MGGRMVRKPRISMSKATASKTFKDDCFSILTPDTLFIEAEVENNQH
jgi:hypothetical protein